MKRLLIPLLAALALPTAVEACIFGNCGSKLEAENACKTWQKNGGSYFVYVWGVNKPSKSYDTDFFGYSVGSAGVIDSVIKKSQELRKCSLEEETKRFLGLQTKGKKGKVYKIEGIYKSYNYDIRPEIKWEVKKRFKY